jgi:hypothetical protein
LYFEREGCCALRRNGALPVGRDLLDPNVRCCALLAFVSRPLRHLVLVWATGSSAEWDNHLALFGDACPEQTAMRRQAALPRPDATRHPLRSRRRGDSGTRVLDGHHGHPILRFVVDVPKQHPAPQTEDEAEVGPPALDSPEQRALIVSAPPARLAG